MSIFDGIKFLYTKIKQVPSDWSTSSCIMFNKWLSQDADNLEALKCILPYMLYIDPIHYFYLLFFHIPKKSNVPYLKISKKQTVEEDALLNKVKYVLEWSNKDIKRHERILNKTILQNKDYWKRELGISNG